MAYNDILHKTELAFSAALATVATAQSLTQFNGLDTDSKTRKSLTVMAENSEPLYPGSANRQVTVAVKVKTNMDDFTPTNHRELCQEVFDVLFDTGIVATLSAALANFTCFFVEELGEQQTSLDRSHETTARFLVNVAPSDIS